MRPKDENICRPDRGILILSAILVIPGVILTYLGLSKPGINSVPNVAFGAFLILFGLLPAYWIFSASFKWDEKGIFIRSWGMPRFISWSEITDYYLEIYSQKREYLSVFVTNKRKYKFRNDFMIGVDKLHDAMITHADNVSYKKWIVVGFRPNDAPVISEYKKNDVISGIFLFVTLFIAINYWILLAFNNATASISITGIPLALALFITKIIGFCTYCLVTWPTLRQTFDAFHRMMNKEVITASVSGITYKDKNKVVDIPWSDIDNWYVENISKLWEIPRNYCITSSQDKVTFLTSISNFHSIKHALNKYAGNKLISNKTTENTSFTVSDLTGLYDVSKDRKLFHFKTRNARATLIFIGVFFTQPFLIYYSQSVFGMTPLNATALTLSGVFSVFIISMCYLVYNKTAVITSNDYIETIIPFGERRLSWTDIIECTYVDGYYIILKGYKGKLRFWIMISDLNDLIKTIQSQCPQAKFINMEKLIGTD